jgi:hypothetical protein
VDEEPLPPLPLGRLEAAVDQLHARVSLLEGVLAAIAATLSAETRQVAHGSLDIVAAGFKSLYADVWPETAEDTAETMRQIADGYGSFFKPD